MARKLLFLNVLLLAAIAVMAQQFVTSWASFEAELSPLMSARLGSPEISIDPVPPPERGESLPQFLVIADRDLFGESRGSDPEEAGLEGEEEAPPALPVNPQLISVSSFAGERRAVLNVFEGKRGTQATPQKVQLGDDVQGYRVETIGENFLVLAWKEHSLTLDLDRSALQAKKPVRAAGGGPNIITIGSAVAAVETTTAEEVAEGRGLEVGVVSARNQMGRGAGQQGAGQGAGMAGGSMGRGTLGRGAGGTLGRSQGLQNQPGTGVVPRRSQSTNRSQPPLQE